MQSQHDNPIDVVQHLITSIGPRQATSLAEAQAAAHIDGWLRRVGMGVSANTFRAPRNPGFTYPVISLLGVAAALLSAWFPFVSLFLALWGLMLIISDALFTPLPVLGLQRDSQNIIGTQPCSGGNNRLAPAPRWRVVLLAPLDSPHSTTGMYRVVGQRRTLLIGRIIAFSLLIFFNLLVLFNQQVYWWYIQVIPAAYLLMILLPLPVTGSYHRSAPALTAKTGALAVLLSAAARLRELQSIELWVVALGATATGNSGLQDLLTRYPFPKEQTLMIVLDSIGKGQLTYASREGVLQQWRADALLMRLAAAVNAKHPTIDAIPRPYRAAPSLANHLHRLGYRALTLIADADIKTASAAAAGGHDVDPQAIERATHLVAGIVQQLDDESV